MGNKKISYFIKSYSGDICFCYGGCKNIECSRNKNGDFYKNLIKYNPHGWFSFSDLHTICKDFVKEEK